MGMRGKVTQDSLNESEAAEFWEQCVGDRQLSWTVGKFSSHDHWPVKLYEAETGESGTLVITDLQFAQVTFVYAKNGVDWHTLSLEYLNDDGDWKPFKISVEFVRWQTHRRNRRLQA
jgi:hypothetical protein